MVHFPGLARTRLWIQRAVCRFYRHGFPYSEIPGSKPACGSPRLIAASHVLHRLLAPRHPPYALCSLTIKLTRHVAPALACRGSSLVRIIRLSTIRSLEQNLRTTTRCKSFQLRNGLPRVCQLLQLSKSATPGYRPGRSAPGETFEDFRSENKKPGVERRANPPAKERKRFRAMLDSIIIRYS